MDLSNETIYTKYKDDLIRYASMLVGPSDAEDVLSTVVLRLLERRSLGDLEDPRRYLFRAITNEARGIARRKKRTRGLPALPSGSDGIPEKDYEVAAALSILPPRQLAAVYLVYWEDQTIRNAARTLGTTSGTVKRYLHLARRKLKELIDNE